MLVGSQMSDAIKHFISGTVKHSLQQVDQPPCLHQWAIMAYCVCQSLSQKRYQHFRCRKHSLHNNNNLISHYACITGPSWPSVCVKACLKSVINCNTTLLRGLVHMPLSLNPSNIFHLKYVRSTLITWLMVEACTHTLGCSNNQCARSPTLSKQLTHHPLTNSTQRLAHTTVSRPFFIS